MAIISSTSYSVHLGKSAFTAVNQYLRKQKPSSVFILCDENTLQHCLPILIRACPLLAEAEIIEIEAGEQSKSLDISALIWQTLIENGADRQSLLVNLGGGVVSDLGAFCASIYKRGIPYITIPTSLLAMVDASVGSKTGIDFMELKNILGTFAPPKGVFIFPDFLQTLPDREKKNGLAEVYKMALVQSASLWKQLRQLNTLNIPESIIAKSITLKNNVVKKDPFDQHLRQTLNFGHSIGHAIESVYLRTQQPLLHGEAVVCGMIMESHLAWQQKRLSKSQLDEIAQTLFTQFQPRDLSALNLKEMLMALGHDKKNTTRQFRFSLLEGIGKCGYQQKVSEKQIEKALVYYHTLFA